MLTWFKGPDESEFTSVSGIRAKVYPLRAGDPRTLWIADVTDDDEPTEHPTRYTAKVAAERRLWSRVQNPPT